MEVETEVAEELGNPEAEEGTQTGNHVQQEVPVEGKVLVEGQEQDAKSSKKQGSLFLLV